VPSKGDLDRSHGGEAGGGGEEGKILLSFLGEEVTFAGKKRLQRMERKRWIGVGLDVQILM